MASHDAPGSTLTVFSSMQGVRAPTDPSHWHAATRVLPARVQRICRPTRNVHRARKPSCASSAATTVVSTRSDHFIATLSPRAFDPTCAKARGKAPGGTDGNGSVKLQLRHRASPPRAQTRSSSARQACPSTTKVRHNQDAAPQELIGKAPAPATLRAHSWLASMT